MTLLEHTPQEYRDAPEVQVTEDALGGQLRQLQTARDEVLAQLSVSTATWGLELWERTYGLETDVSKPLEQRRERVVAKIRGTGTITEAMLKNVAESYTNGEVEVIGWPREYAIDVRFVSVLGTPPNIDDLSAALDEICPAHLVYRYLYRYLLIREIHGVMTLEELERQTLDKFAFGVK